MVVRIFFKSCTLARRLRNGRQHRMSTLRERIDRLTPAEYAREARETALAAKTRADRLGMPVPAAVLELLNTSEDELERRRANAIQAGDRGVTSASSTDVDISPVQENMSSSDPVQSRSSSTSHAALDPVQEAAMQMAGISKNIQTDLAAGIVATEHEEILKWLNDLKSAGRPWFVFTTADAAKGGILNTRRAREAPETARRAAEIATGLFALNEEAIVSISGNFYALLKEQTGEARLLTDYDPIPGVGRAVSKHPGSSIPGQVARPS
ncbi:hypothetical protein [Rhodococcus opacus]